jgi:hypothetical protein
MSGLVEKGADNYRIRTLDRAASHGEAHARSPTGAPRG